jgi:hypothetical protein
LNSHLKKIRLRQISELSEWGSAKASQLISSSSVGKSKQFLSTLIHLTPFRNQQKKCQSISNPNNLKLLTFFDPFFFLMDKKARFFLPMVKKCPNECQIISSYDQTLPYRKRDYAGISFMPAALKERIVRRHDQPGYGYEL